jgi:hypothetical protein
MLGPATTPKFLKTGDYSPLSSRFNGEKSISTMLGLPYIVGTGESVVSHPGNIGAAFFQEKLDRTRDQNYHCSF